MMQWTERGKSNQRYAGSTPQKGYRQPAAAPAQHIIRLLWQASSMDPLEGAPEVPCRSPDMFCRGAGLLWAHRPALPALQYCPKGWTRGGRPDSLPTLP
jgi:hypothetical protein